MRCHNKQKYDIFALMTMFTSVIQTLFVFILFYIYFRLIPYLFLAYSILEDTPKSIVSVR